MHLNDRSIREAVRTKHLIVSPEPKDLQYQPASLDLTLGNEFFELSPGVAIDATQRIDLTSISTREVVEGAYYVEPGAFVLATTVESIGMPHDLVARVEGRSSLGRIGLMVHVTAGFIDPGFSGNITLEICNVSKSTIILFPGMRICQLSFTKLNEPAQRPYGHPDLGSKYQGQIGVTASRIGYDKRS